MLYTVTRVLASLLAYRVVKQHNDAGGSLLNGNPKVAGKGKVAVLAIPNW